MSDEPFTRLLQEQKKATAQTELTIDQLSAFKSDYESLISRLEELQKSLAQPALVPFGRKALVHGKLIHTNEILIHLGGAGGGCEHEYFAKLSTHESIGLIRRRIERIDNQIELLQRQKTLIEDRIAYTSQLADKPPHIITNPIEYDEGHRKASDEEVEIREDYDSDAEKHWRQEHHKRFQQKNDLNTSNKPQKKKVSFDLSNIKPKLSDPSESSDTSCESGLPTIYFTHRSSIQSTVISTTQSGELCHLSPSEMVDIVVRHGCVQSTLHPDDSVQALSPLTSEMSSATMNDISKHQIRPDGDSSPGNPFTGAVVEHKSETVSIPVQSNENVTRISKFRTSRMHAKVK